MGWIIRSGEGNYSKEPLTYICYMYVHNMYMLDVYEKVD